MKTALLFLFVLSFSCRSHQTATRSVDPWHGIFLHQSEKFTLILNHFDKGAVAVDIFEKNQKNSRNSFFADIKDSSAIFKDRTDSNCRLILESIESGINVSDQCHGTGDIDGLYKRIGDKI